MGSLLLKKGSHCSPHVHPVFFVVSKAEQYVTRRSFYQGRLCEPKSEKKKKAKVRNLAVKNVAGHVTIWWNGSQR